MGPGLTVSSLLEELTSVACPEQIVCLQTTGFRRVIQLHFSPFWNITCKHITELKPGFNYKQQLFHVDRFSHGKLY